MVGQLTSFAELVFTRHDTALVLSHHVLEGDVETAEFRLTFGHVEHGQEELLEGEPMSSHPLVAPDPVVPESIESWNGLLTSGLTHAATGGNCTQQEEQ